MKVLIIMAHPDDEVFGMGGTLLRHKSAGDEIFIHILTDGHSSRIKEVIDDKYKDKSVKERIKNAEKVFNALKVKDFLIDYYDDQKLDAYPLLQITQSIEAFSNKINPDIVYTHFKDDVNEDHRITFRAVLNAFRPAQKKMPTKIISVNIPSSTEWGYSAFQPNYFVDISNFLEKKIKLISLYKAEVKQYPHPRSVEKIINSAKAWGAVINADAAEPFFIIREIWKL